MKIRNKGFEVLSDGKHNKSVAFTREERELYGLRGLLPYSTVSQDVQVKRIMDGLKRKSTDIERYILLSLLHDRNEKLFYRVVTEYIEEVMPIIYTPTVGQACKEFSNNFKRTRGFYITPEDKGEISKILDNWPEDYVKVIVVTDGERILGLGDLGANGMGIPIGKLELYCACAGIHPHQCLPVMLDVGTNNDELLDDILYLGYPFKRLQGEEYFELVDEFVQAVQEKYPKALIQFEDFLTPNAYTLLNKYKDKVLCFNDDIQGTAAVALSGVYASTRITGIPFKDLKVMFLGAGSAATGIADLMVAAYMKEGLSKEEAHRQLWFVDVNGLVVEGRGDLMEHNLPYAHSHEQLGFEEAINAIQPHILIGATGVGGTFTQTVIEKMTALNDRPVIFALSNPTSKAECTAEQAYEWSDGKAIFASGSPFDMVNYKGQEFKPGQGNNAYVFPGIGLGAIICNAKNIPDELFLVAAKTLSDLVSDEDIDAGALYPKLKEIRNLSLEIAVAVADKAYELGIAKNQKPHNLRKFITDYMFNPEY
ncbi:NAD-dependent malic enzyme [Sediminitomix flava]|uniref:Malate dehydrogenase (Oxaloacetate-decarboxylating)(NADP+) n=1 Tax=Sediminitomix flava TaxID=379075 RepID=A0A315ZDK8_SEDFL|nr:NAD-dependent malic enzyme [Sediminitomix flava]PWJ43412.1 malate dehydrogenase (oxaloacetate-decarboxylating)(NADP+) [Sediminitomix flava]